ANPRDAFCCASCEAGFYRAHCRVCEKELGDAKRNSRRELCGRRQCRNQFRSFRAQFFSVWYPSAIGASKPEKSSSTPSAKFQRQTPRSTWLMKFHSERCRHASRSRTRQKRSIESCRRRRAQRDALRSKLQLEFCGAGPRWRLSGGSKVDN